MWSEGPRAHDERSAPDGRSDNDVSGACKVPIEDFPKNHDSEHDFHDQHDVNGQKSCSFLVILIDPDDFRDKNHDFSARGTNCLKRVIEAAQNVKITFFRQLHRANRFFVTFL